MQSFRPRRVATSPTGAAPGACSPRRCGVDEDDVFSGCGVAVARGAKADGQAGATALGSDAVPEGVAGDVESLPVRACDRAEVLDVVEPQHLAADSSGSVLIPGSHHDLLWPTGPQRHPTRSTAYHFERRPRRLVYRSFGGADRNPDCSNCSR